jgi:23S rRNA pseudouridine2605 synthase
VKPDARITLAGRSIPGAVPARIVLALHKPRGVLTTARDPQGRPTVFELLPQGGPRLLAVGRLDKASRGLLLLTSDASLADRLTDPARHVPKTYHAKVDRPLETAAITRLSQGVRLDDGARTRPCRVRLLRTSPRSCWIELVLTEGRNRQVRRMVEAVGARVTDLVRVSVGRLPLGALKPGEIRRLTPGDLALLDIIPAP